MGALRVEEKGTRTDEVGLNGSGIFRLANRDLGNNRAGLGFKRRIIEVTALEANATLGLPIHISQGRDVRLEPGRFVLQQVKPYRYR